MQKAEKVTHVHLKHYGENNGLTSILSDAFYEAGFETSLQVGVDADRFAFAPIDAISREEVLPSAQEVKELLTSIKPKLAGTDAEIYLVAQEKLSLN